MLIYLFICQFLKKMFAARKSGEYFQFRLKSHVCGGVCKNREARFFLYSKYKHFLFQRTTYYLEKSETITKKIYKCYLCHNSY